MITPRPLSLVFLFFAAIHLHTRLIISSAAPAPAPSPAIPIPNDDSDFIRSSCKTTLYPDTCYNSLSSYASVVQQDPGRLAFVAIGVSLEKAKLVAAYLSNFSREAASAGPRARAALRDCFSMFRDTVDEMRESLSEMRSLGGSGESLRFQMSNVQTWMSAALTNEETCTDGFEDVPDGPFKSDISHLAAKVKELTSNALALINTYANHM